MDDAVVVEKGHITQFSQSSEQGKKKQERKKVSSIWNTKMNHGIIKREKKKINKRTKAKHTRPDIDPGRTCGTETTLFGGKKKFDTNDNFFKIWRLWFVSWVGNNLHMGTHDGKTNEAKEEECRFLRFLN